jgi:hypothetical protein
MNSLGLSSKHSDAKSIEISYPLAAAIATGLFAAGRITGSGADHHSDARESTMHLKESDSKVKNQYNLTLILFYLGFVRTSGKKKFYISDILKWHTTYDGEWETEHEFIQWIFPTKTPSNFNARAPVLEKSIADTLVEIEMFRANYAWCFSRFMSFLNIVISVSSETSINFGIFIDPQEFFMHLQQHNFLRLSRVLESLLCFGYTQLAEQLYYALNDVETEEIATEKPDLIQHFNEAKSNYWSRIITVSNYPWFGDGPSKGYGISSVNEQLFYSELKNVLRG